MPTTGWGHAAEPCPLHCPQHTHFLFWTLNALPVCVHLRAIGFVCVCACVRAYLCLLDVMRKMLNEVLQSVYVISRVHYALGCAYILSILLLLYWRSGLTFGVSALQIPFYITVQAAPITMPTTGWDHTASPILFPDAASAPITMPTLKTATTAARCVSNDANDDSQQCSMHGPIRQPLATMDIHRITSHSQPASHLHPLLRLSSLSLGYSDIPGS